MNPLNPPPQSQAISKESRTDDTVRDTQAFPIMQAVQQLLSKRDQIEQFAQDSYSRLNQLRELIRAEREAAESELAKKNGAFESPRLLELQTQADFHRRELEITRSEAAHFRQQLEAIRSERDAVCLHNEQLEREARQHRLEHNVLADELAQVKHQVEQQAEQSARFDDLLQAFVAESGQREEAALAERRQIEEECSRLREELAAMERHNPELTAKLDQDSGRSEITARLPSSPIQADATTPPPSAGQPMLNFPCKYCQEPLQAKQRLAGLVAKCHRCGKMAPVPKLGC